MKANPLRSRRGFTLVEIMVAMAIGLVITAGAAALFIGNRQTYDMAEAVSRIQETGRFAIGEIADDLRMAGHLGCARPAQVTVTSVGAGLNAATLDQPVTYDTTERELTIPYAEGASAPLVADMDTPGDTVDIDANDDDATLQAGDRALIANCTRADIFSVTGVATANGGADLQLSHAATDDDDNTVNANANLSEDYEVGDGTPPRVRAFRVHEYGVADSSATNGAGDTISVLTLNGSTLIRGVERMEVRFGECSDTGQIGYSAWGGVADPSRIVSVRVGLLLRSEQRVLEQADSESYEVAGVTVDPPGAGNGNAEHAGDRRLRQAFSTTVSLRNERAGEC